MATMRQKRVTSARGERGYILVPVLGVVLSIVVLSVVLSQGSAGAIQRVGYEVEDARLDAIAESAIDLGLQDLWSRYKQALGENRNDLVHWREFLDAQGIAHRAQGEASTGDFDIFGQLAAEAEPWKDILPLASLKRNAVGEATLLGARVHRLEVLRQDSQVNTALRARAIVSFGKDPSRRHQVEVERLFFVGGETFSGFGFALLANNVNCIMCHATIDSAERYYNTDDALRGSFPRVRVGTMESLKIRSGSADSSVAGAIYTRGPVMEKDGTLLPGLEDTSLTSMAFDENRKLIEDWTGDMDVAVFINAVGDPLPAGENLYMNYPSDSDKQTDGKMPESFPPVIPDTNGNRLVDAVEYAEVAMEADGTLTGGLKVRVPPGGSYGASSLPNGNSLAMVSGNLNGHLVAYGTAANPIVINGRITVDGDVVIGGVVKGSGEIIARNNTYILGNLVYQDAFDGLKRRFGVAADGTQNRLTLGAGGNMLVGDYLRGKKAPDGITGEVDGGFNFTLSETTIFGQMEWVRTQPTVPISEGSSTMVANPVYDPDYIPRYYVVEPGNPVAIFNKEDTYFDIATRTWLGKEHLGDWKTELLTLLPVGHPERTEAAVVALNPENGWLDVTKLQQMWTDCESTHAGGPLLVDAFLYTNNAIFLMSPKASAYEGQALINGGLVGADLGILVGNGLRLNYDARHTGALDLEEEGTTKLTLIRGARLR